MAVMSMEGQKEQKTHSIIIKPEGEPIFSEMATIIGVDDEAGGVFFTIHQSIRDGDMTIRFDTKEWPHIVAAVENLMGEWE